MNNNINTSNSTKLLAVLKIFEEEYPEKQLGKTMIQKLCFILSRENVLDYEYSLHHYGPYSSEVESDLDVLDFFDDIQIEWNNFGYDVETKKEGVSVPAEELEKIREVVQEYGGYTATDLSLIATAFYLKDNLDIEDKYLVNEVHDIKPKFNHTYIKEVLEQANVI